MAKLIEEFDLIKNGQEEGKVQIYSENSGYWAFLCRQDGKYYSHIRVSDERQSVLCALSDSQETLQRMGYSLKNQEALRPRFTQVILFPEPAGEREIEESVLASS